MKIKYLFIIFFFILLWPKDSQAVVLSIESKASTLPSVKDAELVINIDTEQQNINALEGDLVLPANIKVNNIFDSSEIISFWVEKPAINGTAIHFSGITPGGFKGRGILFRVIVRSDIEQQTIFKFANLQSLLNDGLGTAVNISGTNFYLNFVSDTSVAPVEISISDHELPENFTPIISRLDEIESGIFFLVFDTQDKGTGIDHYEVREGWRRYQKAVSPYRLRNQKLNEDVFVKAVDKMGNERIVKVLAFYPKAWYEKIEFYAIILFVLVVLFVLYKKKIVHVKSSNKNKR